MRDMKTQLRKRVLAIIVMMITVLGMSFTSFASKLDHGKTGEPGTPITNGVDISKEIIFINDETTNVREPNITYEYTVSAASPASTTTVNDGTKEVYVKQGVLDANTNANHKATVTFSESSRFEATATGKADTKPFTLNFNPTKFSEAGIYRYKVEETIATTSRKKADVGVVQAPTYKSARYLDVYVEQVATGLQIYGYVLYDGDAEKSLTTTSEKSNGWVNTSSDTTPANVDVYTTHNVVVNKKIEGSMANKSHKFPFAIDIIPGSVDGSTKLDVTTTGSFPTSGGPSSDSVGSYITGSGNPAKATLNVLLGNGNEATISGIPETSSIVVTETNDTSQIYKVGATRKVGTAAATTVLPQTTVDVDGTAKVDLISESISANTEIAFTNTLNAPSPTGLILHYGPFMLVALLAIGLLVMSFKKKKQ